MKWHINDVVISTLARAALLKVHIQEIFGRCDSKGKPRKEDIDELDTRIPSLTNLTNQGDVDEEDEEDNK